MSNNGYKFKNCKNLVMTMLTSLQSIFTSNRLDENDLKHSDSIDVLPKIIIKYSLKLFSNLIANYEK